MKLRSLACGAICACLASGVAVAVDTASIFTPGLLGAETAHANKSAQTLFTNVNVFDGKSSKLAMGQDVLVEGNLIKKIGKGLKAGNDAAKR